MGSKRIAHVLLVAIVLTLTACGSSSKQSATMVPAGQIDLHNVELQPPPGSRIVTERNGAIRLEAGQSGASNGAASGGSTGNTIPLAKQDPTTALFTSLNVFQSCLQGLGVKFVGAPDRSNPNSPTNNPTYIKNLTTCAAKSNILQALKNAQSAQDNLTPAQIKKENEGYLAWRTCMVGRGWGIPKPTPDSRGLLFSFGGGGGGGGGGGSGGSSSSAGAGFTPPPGQSLLTSSDMQDCANQAQQGSTNSGG
jgi:hypothetical protein